MQLRAMINGGNQPAAEFLAIYDLDTEPVQRRYSTVAMEFYRANLRMRVLGQSG